MQRKKLILLAAALLLSAGVIWIITSKGSGKDPRMAYEQFIRAQYDNYPAFADKNIKVDSDQAALDRPDLAALNEYIKTVDPATQTVPTQKLVEANIMADQLMSLKSTQDDITWVAQPTDMGGRTRTLMFDPNDPAQKKVWAGSVTGGLWFNSDPLAGESWQPVNDFWSNLSISCMTYDPANPQTFYIGTGESQTALIMYRESSGRGTGIMRSTDGGQSWSLIPSTADWAYVTDIIVRQENSVSVIYAGVASGIYKGAGHQSNPSDGLYRSVDGGDTWTQVLPLIPESSQAYCPSDIEMNADKSRIFVGTTYGINNEANDNDRSGAGCILWSDDGINWTVNDIYHNNMVSQNKFPGRVMLTQAPSDANVMLAIVASGYVRSDLFIGYGCEYLLKTTDKGGTWNELNFPSGFASLAWHAFAITVSPFNHNVIWVGGLDTYRTVNGGTDWTRMSDWSLMYGDGSPRYVHADIHVIKYKTGSDNELYVATDGGVFGSRSAASPTNVIFFELNRGYSTLQYYSCAMHPDAGAVHYIGGLQDNGTMFYKKNDTPTFTDMLSGGDGALCFIDQDNPRIQLTTVYHNSVYLWVGDKELDPRQIRSRGFNSGMFVNAMDYDWKNDILYANGTSEEGNNKNTLLVVGVSETNINGTLQNLNTQSSVAISNIKYSEYSPTNLSTIYLGNQVGKLWKLSDAAHIGTLTDLTGSGFPTANISSIDIGQSEDNLLVTFSNYGVASVWSSRDGGSTWKNIEGNLPDMPIRWGIFHPEHDIEIMLATETGIWYTQNIEANPVVWVPANHGLANVRIDMLKYRKSDKTVLAASHGRGFFTTTWNPNPNSGLEDGVELLSVLKVYPNPTSGIFEALLPACENIKLSISDMTGRVILSESYTNLPEGSRKSFDLSREPRGMYLVRVIADHNIYSSRLNLK